MRRLVTTPGTPPKRPIGSFRVAIANRTWSFSDYGVARDFYEALEDEATLWEMDDDPRLIVAKIWS